MSMCVRMKLKKLFIKNNRTRTENNIATKTIIITFQATPGHMCWVVSLRLLFLSFCVNTKKRHEIYDVNYLKGILYVKYCTLPWKLWASWNLQVPQDSFSDNFMLLIFEIASVVIKNYLLAIAIIWKVFLGKLCLLLYNLWLRRNYKYYYYFSGKAHEWVVVDGVLSMLLVRRIF